MPNINLRLTEAEHEQLQRWASASRRSLQKEIVHRLFRQPAPVGSRTAGAVVDADSQSRDVQARTVDVKPDFK